MSLIEEVRELLSKFKLRPRHRYLQFYQKFRNLCPVEAIIPPGEKIKYTNVIEINYAQDT